MFHIAKYVCVIVLLFFFSETTLLSLKQLVLTNDFKIGPDFDQSEVIWEGWTQIITNYQACDCDMFKKPKLDIESPAGPTMVEAERKILVFSPSKLLEVIFPKARKVFYSKSIYYICTFLPSLPQLFNFYTTVTRFSSMKTLKNVSRKNGILLKTGKIKCLKLFRARKTFPSRWGPLNKLFIWYICFIGFKSIFTRAENLWCTQHIEKNDSEQLRYYCSNGKDRWKIVADIYVSQNEVLLQEGLVDIVVKDDFKTNLVSLKPPLRFHCWFEDNRSEIFIECLVFTAREKRFSTYTLEAKHRLQKKTLNEEEVPREMFAVTEFLGKWFAFVTQRHKGLYEVLRNATWHQSMSTSM